MSADNAARLLFDKVFFFSVIFFFVLKDLWGNLFRNISCQRLQGDFITLNSVLCISNSTFKTFPGKKSFIRLH